MVIKLGNLGPRSRAVLTTKIGSKLDIVGGYYAYVLSQAFFPDYKKHGVSKNAYPYEFSYQVLIHSRSISNLVIPDGATIE